MWAAFFVSFLFVIFSRKMFGTYPAARAFVNAPESQFVKIKKQPCKVSPQSFWKKLRWSFFEKYLERKHLYNMRHHKYPYCIFRYNKPISWHPYSISRLPYCIYASTKAHKIHKHSLFLLHFVFCCHVVTSSYFGCNYLKTYLLSAWQQCDNKILSYFCCHAFKSLFIREFIGSVTTWQQKQSFYR